MNTLDSSMITQAIADLDRELALLTRRRQLLTEVLATFDGTPVAAPARPQTAPIQRREPAVASPPARPKAAAKPKAPAPPKVPLRKWDWDEVGRIHDDALAAGQNPRLVLLNHYSVNEAMSYYLLKQLKLRRKTEPNLPKGPVDTGRFTPDDAASLIEANSAHTETSAA